MTVETYNTTPPAGRAIAPREPTPSEAPAFLTYEQLRRLMVDSGSMDERDAGRLDRAYARLLDR